MLCELAKDGFYATFSNEQPLSDIPESCRVYAIEMHADDQHASRESAAYETQTVQILLLHVERRQQSLQRSVCFIVYSARCRPEGTLRLVVCASVCLCMPDLFSFNGILMDTDTVINFTRIMVLTNRTSELYLFVNYTIQ